MPKTQVTAEQLAKLPKWARDEITSRDGEIRDLKEILARVNGPDDAHVTALQQTGGGDRERITQKIEAPYGVRFDLGGVHGASVTVRREQMDNGAYRLQLMADGYPTQFIVTPHVTNVIYVGVTK